MKKYFIMLQIFNAVSILVAGQNVGIGTSTPAEKLHVAGNIKTDTIKPNAIKLAPNAGAGKVLTSDAAGNANWQSSNAASATGNIGFGVWGDCATNGNISEYNPVADATGSAGDQFGTSVSISGNFAIVGAPFDDAGANTGQGSASIYQYNGSTWVLMQKLTEATGAAEDLFGYCVSISGNYAVVGVAGDEVGSSINQGSANIYWYNGTSWVLMQKLTDATGAANDIFGVSVSISGNYTIIGAPYDDTAVNTDQGSASIYRYNGSNWVLMEKLTDSTGAPNDFFGWSVSISGNYTIVGAYHDDVNLSIDQGSASIYQYNGSSWVLMQQLTDATPSSGEIFGVSVSISGNYAIVGAEFDHVGANSYQGSASIYQFNGSTWILMQKLTDPAGAGDDLFGLGVSISDNYAMVGAQGTDVGTNSNKGSVSIYVRVGNSWGKLQFTTDPMGNVDDYFGIANAIDGNTKRFLIGANGYISQKGKVVFGKVN